MISLIICSRSTALSPEFVENIKQTIGVQYEIVIIDNSQNKHSIYSAYNLGVKLSKSDYFCFVHDDVLFHTQNWGQKIINHLNVPGTGIIGLAGGDAVTRVPSDWSALNPSVNIIHTDRQGIEPQEVVHFPKDYKNSSRSVVLLDGVFMCMNKSFFEKLKFDESIGGFHGYDYDISIQAFIAGYTNYVIYDITVEHFSKGNMDATYFRTLKKMFEKWEDQLPLFERSISIEEQNHLLPQLEKKRIYKLIKRLVRSGMPAKETAEYISIYTRKTNSKTAIFLLNFIRIRIFFIRISSAVRNKNNY